jgi:hypothetical protein
VGDRTGTVFMGRLRAIRKFSSHLEKGQERGARGHFRKTIKIKRKSKIRMRSKSRIKIKIKIGNAAL